MHKISIPQAAIDRVLKRRDSLHVFRDIEGARTAHIVVDLQNGFMAPGQPIEISAAREIVPNVNRISATLRAAGGMPFTFGTRSTPRRRKRGPSGSLTCRVKNAWSAWKQHLSTAATVIRSGRASRFSRAISQ